MNKQRHLNRIPMAWLLLLAVSTGAAGAIQAPDHILYGLLDEPGDSVTLETGGAIIAEFASGADPEADAREMYVLRVPMDAVGARSPDRMRPGDAAALHVNGDPEPAALVTIGEPGIVTLLHLETHLDADGARDTDDDGISDHTEAGLGLDPNHPGDAALDLDGDGWFNLLEHLAGGGADDPNLTPADAARIALGTSQEGRVLINGRVGNELIGDEDNAVHPAWCDLDGDGTNELVLGYGPGSGGVLHLYDADDDYLYLDEIQGGWQWYNDANGATWPACGDLDLDGKDELVIGHGEGSGGWLRLFEQDGTDYVPMAVGADGWIQRSWSYYRRINGSMYPTVGNIDDDPAPEIAFGFGAGADGWSQVVDDLATGLTHKHWVQTQSGGDGASYAAICYGDEVGELLLGAGEGNDGHIAIYVLDPGSVLDTTPDTRMDLGNLLSDHLGRALIPACGDLDDDGLDEILLALGPGADHRALLIDDLADGANPLGLLLPQVSGNGELWPAMPATDGDRDGWADRSDNCPLVANADQHDVDGDGRGDVCDEDIDGDTLLNEHDGDMDGDGIGNQAETDAGLDEQDPRDSAGDLDGDSCANLNERIAGSGLSNPGIAPADLGIGPIALGTSRDGRALIEGFGELLGELPNAVHPAWCDIDGDGDHELVLGYGKDSGGRLDLYDDAAGGYAHLGQIPGGWSKYNEINGATWPACGDLDLDGRDELVVGHGEGSRGWIRLFAHDGYGYLPMPVGITGWVQVAWNGYRQSNGEVHPTIGNIDDSDPEPELTLGFGPGANGWGEVRDDLANGLAHKHWVRTPAGGDGASHTAICYSAAHGPGELLLGAGEGNDGRMVRFVLDPNSDLNTSPDAEIDLTDQLQDELGRALVPACGDLDGDGADELLVALGSSPDAWPSHRLLLRDDAAGADQPLGWLLPALPGDGSLWPAMPATDSDDDKTPNLSDNCPFDANADQHDLDGDGAGDVCDDDIDGDGLPNGQDDDMDGDGIDNATEQQTAGLDERDPTDATGDLDQDGWNNLVEVLAGSGAHDPSSTPAGTGVGPIALGTSRDGRVLIEGYGELLGKLTGVVHPAWCDIDGDGTHELVLGYGEGSAGRLDLYDDLAGGHAHLAPIEGGWTSYNQNNGATWPACGDLDLDGRDDLVVGHGRSSAGWIRLFSHDGTAFEPMPVGMDGWLQVAWESYRQRNGAVHPAIGNLDADPELEVALGFGAGAGGWGEVLDDITTGLAHKHWVQTPTGGDGASYLAICYSSGGTPGELMLGAGNENDGHIACYLLDPDSDAHTIPDTEIDLTDQLQSELGRALVPACADIDGDGADELLVALGPTPDGKRDHRVLLRDDALFGDAALGQLLLDLFGDGSLWPATSPTMQAP